MRHFRLNTVAVVSIGYLDRWGYGWREHIRERGLGGISGAWLEWDFRVFGYRSIKTGALIVSRSSLYRFACWCFWHGYFRLWFFTLMVVRSESGMFRA